MPRSNSDLIVLMAAGVSFLSLCSCSTPRNAPETLVVAGNIVETSRSPEGGGILTITKSGVVVHRQTNAVGAFYIGPNSPETDAKNLLSLSPGTDITGNGIPDLIVTEWTGGAHCCFTAHVFELGEAFARIGQIPGGDGGVLFRDLNGDGIYEAVIQEEQ
jgi:hypothetical protein